MSKSVNIQGDVNERITETQATASLRIYLNADQCKQIAEAIATGKRDDYVNAFVTIALSHMRRLPPGIQLANTEEKK